MRLSVYKIQQLMLLRWTANGRGMRRLEIHTRAMHTTLAICSLVIFHPSEKQTLVACDSHNISCDFVLASNNASSTVSRVSINVNVKTNGRLSQAQSCFLCFDIYEKLCSFE